MVPRMVDASLKTKIDIKPSGTQTLLVALVVAAIVSLVCSAILVAQGQMHGLWFLAFAFLPLLGSVFLWTKSQSDIDLGNSKPASVVNADGSALTFDNRTLRDQTAVAGLKQILETFQRVPLPVPSGTVDAQFQVIPNSESAARNIAEKINAQSREQVDVAIDKLRAPLSASTVIQPPIDNAAPQGLPEPGLNDGVGSTESSRAA